MKKKQKILAFASMAALALGLWWLHGLGWEETDDAQIEAHVSAVSARVPGYIKEVLVDSNMPVKAGDVLVRLDPLDYQHALDAAQANLKSAEARLDSATHGYTGAQVMLSSNLSSAQAQVQSTQARWTQARQELDRLSHMTDASRSRSQLEVAVAAESTAHSGFLEAQEKLKSAQTAPDTAAAVAGLVASMQAGVDKAKADVATAQKNLADTEIRAPFDGTVARRTGEKGAYAAPGQSLMAVVGTDLWVVANFKETQIEKMRPGAEAEIGLDVAGGHELKGHVDSIQPGTGARFSLFPPENATGNFVKVVQRVPVKILFDEKPGPDVHLGPGMSVEPRVNVR
jgi:membrane fusion protein (multidrug efflux system)